MEILHELNLNAREGETRPIGIFDSGVGGLSVWREIRKQLPLESTIYFADQAHVPYGRRSITEVRDYAFGITEFLRKQDSKIIVIACNTASGAALALLRSAFPDNDFIGMEPAVKPAVEKTQTGHVAVIATPTAFQGSLYQQLVRRFGRDVFIHSQTCPGLVEAVENGDVDAPSTISLLQECLAPLVKHNIDQLVLGCTHYPFVLHQAQRILGDSVTLIDPAPAVARQTARILEARALLCTTNNAANHKFYTSDSPELLQTIARRLVGYTGSVSAAHWHGNHILFTR